MVFVPQKEYNKSRVASSHKSFSDKQDRGFQKQKCICP
jgi:hypothetical protein